MIEKLRRTGLMMIGLYERQNRQAAPNLLAKVKQSKVKR